MQSNYSLTLSCLIIIPGKTGKAVLKHNDKHKFSSESSMTINLILFTA